MRNHFWSALLFASVLIPAVCRADGLIYRLPEDGSWVKFDMKLTTARGDQQREVTGSMKMSSVGSATENSKKCRWIEINMTMKSGDDVHTIIAKALIPESELQRGKRPYDNMARGWIRMRANSDVAKIDENNKGPLPGFLAGPLQDEKKLAGKQVESKLGKLMCDGITGSVKFKERNNDNTMKYETRLHEKAPFGVVWTKIEFTVERDGEARESGKMELTLSEVGKDAKSELPDNN